MFLKKLRNSEGLNILFMLGILLIYFIGKRFYDLAEEFEQNKWLYAIIGIVIYYGIGTLLLTFIIVLDIYFFDWGFNWEQSYGMSLLMIPLGIFAVWLFYQFLENRWKKQVLIVKDEIQDIGKDINHNN